MPPKTPPSIDPRKVSILKRASHVYTIYDDEAYEKLKAVELAETAKSIHITGDKTLTPAEYKSANAEFQTFVETPINREEPVYIMPEHDAAGHPHPTLMQLVENIQSGKPYHTFITETHGEIGPPLLRLYYGLDQSRGYKISIQQFHSMMKVAYARMANIGEIACVPIYEAVGSNLNATPAGAALLDSGWRFPGKDNAAQDKKRKQFLLRLQKDKTIPVGELGLLIIKMNKMYLSVAIYALNEAIRMYGATNEVIAYLCILSTYYTQKYGKNPDMMEASIFAQKNGALLFVSAIQSMESHLKVFFINGEPCLIFPSQTLVSAYLRYVNPNSRIKYDRRLGPISPQLFEAHTNDHQRPGVLIMAGITNDIFTHRKMAFPLWAVVHDEYHNILVGLIPPVIYAEILRMREKLREIFPTSRGFFSEITRALDCEILSKIPTEHKLFKLMEYVFSLQLEKPDQAPVFSKSGVVILIDMICSPEHWPSYSKMKEHFVNLFFPIPSGMKADNHIQEVETAARRYMERTGKNLTIAAMLMLFHFELQDPQFSECCSAIPRWLLNPRYIWRKKPHGHLYPVLIVNQKAYTLDDLRSPVKRKNLYAQLNLPLNNFSILHREQVTYKKDTFKQISATVSVGLFKITRTGENFVIEACEKKSGEKDSAAPSMAVARK